MKASTKNYLRGLRHQLGSLIGVVVIIAVAVAFYTTLKTVVVNYDHSTTAYFTDYKFPDAIISGSNFSEADATKVRAVDGVAAVQLRATRDIKSGDNTLRVFSYDTQNPEVNVPYVYEGTLPRNADECLITQKYAENNNVHVGDTLEFTDVTFSDSCVISGLATAPEHMYLQQSEAQPVADKKTFAIVYVDTELAERNALPFNELALRYDAHADRSEVTQKVEAALPAQKMLGVTERDSIFSYQAHHADIEQFEIFAYLFPVVFFFIAAVVIFVSQRRAIMRDRSQIGIMKAMGYSGGRIMWLYVLGTIITVTLGIAAGFGLTLLLGPWIIDAFQVMIAAPSLNFNNAFMQLSVPVVVSLAICIVPTIFAVWQTTRLKPAAAMRPAPPAVGRDILLQKMPFWKHLSFNTRYGLKAALRNRGRFIAMVCGIVAMLALITLSLGFRDSFNHVTTSYYDVTSEYDITAQTKPTPIDTAPGFLGDVEDTAYELTFAIPVTITHDSQSEDMPTFISNDPLRMHAFTSVDGGEIDVSDGVVLPRAVAQKLNVKQGDTVTITSVNEQLDGQVTVTDISDQDIAFRAIMTYEAARKKLGLQNEVYNVVYLQVDGDTQQATKVLGDNEAVISANSLADDRSSYQQLSQTFNAFIVVLVLFSIILGVATLYAISSITLLSRQYEFVVLRVMGYDRGDVLLAYVKELLLQCLLAIPLGLFAGYLLLGQLVTAFELDSMSFSRHITPESFVYAVAITLAVLGIMVFVARHQLAHQDLVEGLKSHSE